MIAGTPLTDLVREFRLLPSVKARTMRLNELIGATTLNPAELQARALLVTALQTNHLWPSTAERA